MAQPVYIAVIGGSDIDPEPAGSPGKWGGRWRPGGGASVRGAGRGHGRGGPRGPRGRRRQPGNPPRWGPGRANPYLTYTIATNLGHARNVLIAHSADALIAVDGSYGTISEAAIALKLGKPAIALKVTWDLPGLKRAATPEAAVAMAWEAVKR